MISDVLKATCVKMAAFWDVPPRSLLDTDRRFRECYFPHHQFDDIPDNGGSKILRKASQCLLDYSIG